MSMLGNHSSKVEETAPKEKAKAAQDLGEVDKVKASDQRLALRIDAKKREKFKLACMRNGTNMTDALQAYIDKYIKENEG